MRLLTGETKNVDLVFTFPPVLVGKGEFKVKVYGLGTDKVTGEPVILYKTYSKYEKETK